jgi:hypothetical protein
MQTHQAQSSARPRRAWGNPINLRLLASGHTIEAGAFGAMLGNSIMQQSQQTGTGATTAAAVYAQNDNYSGLNLSPATRQGLLDGMAPGLNLPSELGSLQASDFNLVGPDQSPQLLNNQQPGDVVLTSNLAMNSDSGGPWADIPGQQYPSQYRFINGGPAVGSPAGATMPGTISERLPYSPSFFSGTALNVISTQLPQWWNGVAPSGTGFIGVNGTLAIIGGGTLGAGLYGNLGGGSSNFDLGVQWDAGRGFGFDPSLGGTVGYNQGPVGSFRGSSTNINLGIDFGGVGGGATTIVTDGHVTGGAYDFGFRSVPVMPGATASVMNVTTCTFGLSNVVSFINGKGLPAVCK